MTSEQRLTAELHPRALPPALDWLAFVREKLKIDARVSEVLRSHADQLKDVSSGKSGVTDGWHNCGWCTAGVAHTVHYSLAVDFLCFDAKGKVIDDGTHDSYRKCGLVWQSLDWHSPIKLANGTVDADHAEFHPGFTREQYLGAIRLGKDWGLTA